MRVFMIQLPGWERLRAGSRARSRTVLWVSLLLAAAAGCGGSDDGRARRLFTGGPVRMGKVAGRVVDEETGAPIVQAQVQVGEHAVKVKADGSFETAAT